MKISIYYCHIESGDPSGLSEGDWFFSPSMGCQCAQVIHDSNGYELRFDVELHDKPLATGEYVRCLSIQECIDHVSTYFDSPVKIISPAQLIHKLNTD